MCSYKRDKNASWAPMYVFVKDVRIDDIFNLFCIESLKEKYFSYELRAFFSVNNYHLCYEPKQKISFSYEMCFHDTHCQVSTRVHERKRKPQTRALGAKVPIRFFDNIP